MALPPCHILCQFSVKNDTQLSCALYQRSCDVPLGSPFNIASYSLLTHLLANMCGLEAHEFIYFMGDCHIYEEHMEIIKTQLDNKPLPFPTITIKQVRQNIDDYQVDDFEIHNYQHYPSLKMKMVA
jgi:thymidylate synthase